MYYRLGPDKPGGPPTQGLTGVRGPPTLTQSPIPARLGSPFVDQRLLGELLVFLLPVLVIFLQAFISLQTLTFLLDLSEPCMLRDIGGVVANNYE